MIIIIINQYFHNNNVLGAAQVAPDVGGVCMLQVMNLQHLTTLNKGSACVSPEKNIFQWFPLPIGIVLGYRADCASCGCGTRAYEGVPSPVHMDLHQRVTSTHRGSACVAPVFLSLWDGGLHHCRTRVYMGSVHSCMGSVHWCR
jgi:hypothetical protein